MLRDIGHYVMALCHHWVAAVTGSLVTLGLGVLPALLDKTTPPLVWGAVLLVGLLPAGFLAWRDERRKVEALTKKIVLRVTLVQQQHPGRTDQSEQFGVVVVNV